MAGGMDLGTSGKGGRKPLDTALNLVPFIDLMAVTIVFLILNAVWTQLGRLQVSQAGASTGEMVEAPTQLPITLLVSEQALTLTVGGSTLPALPVTRDEKGHLQLEALVGKLKELKAQQPEQSSITLSTEDAVRYDDLVRLIDAVVRDGANEPLFPGVAVSPASAG